MLDVLAKQTLVSPSQRIKKSLELKKFKESVVFFSKNEYNDDEDSKRTIKKNDL